jgi:hypothetical protein
MGLVFPQPKAGSVFGLLFTQQGKILSSLWFFLCVLSAFAVGFIFLNRPLRSRR